MLPRRLGAACVVAFLVGSAPAGAEEWFDAYKKGLQALRQRQGAKAVEHFERAIRKRPDPGTNLITYGTNRLGEYHPYLKLAEAHLLAGNPESAREALARSAARGKEPAEERSQIAAIAEAAIEEARMAAATPPPTQAPAPTTLAAAPTTMAIAPATLRPAAPQPTTAAVPVAGGSLDLKSEPEGATVLLAGRLLGTTPLRIELAAGTYQVTLRREGFAELSFPVRVVAGQATTESRALQPTAPAPTPPAPPARADVASLVVYSDPPGAAVALDDEPLGTTDPGSGRLVKSGVAPGPHRVRLSLPGRVDVTLTVEVAPAGPTSVRGTLAEAPRSGAPLVAAAVAAALVLAGLGFVLRKRLAAEAVTVTRPTPRAAAAGSRPITRTTRNTQVSPGTASPLEELVVETRALSPSATPGERFGDYLLLDQLGRGGMASVFKAERNGELCALKRPLAPFLAEPEFLERFLREAEIGRTLHHPNIIRIFERGEVKGVPFFTMELVDGETLQAHVRRQGALDARAATRVIVQVAEALDYAHLKGVVHRDLKPSNIMILEDGAVKVMDYGIARARRFDGLTVTGAFLGTPDYVAPETAEGKGTDARSDLYSLGIVYYEILTGKKPFVGETPFATLRKHCTEAPTPPSVVTPGTPREIEAIILKLLRKDPAERYPGAEELLIELRDYLNRAA